MDENRTRKPPKVKKESKNISENENGLSLNAKNKKSSSSKGNRKGNRKGKKENAGSRRCLMNEWVTEDALKVITTWKRNGLTDEEIEKNIGVAHSTFCAWKKKSKDLSDALKNGRAYANALVENSLFNAAIGGVIELRHPVIDKESGRPVMNDDGTQLTYTDQEYIKPDTKAMIFFLTNRMPKDYQMNRNLKLDMGDDLKKGGTVEIVVRNDSLQELEAAAIEEAKKRDMEAEMNGS